MNFLKSNSFAECHCNIDGTTNGNTCNKDTGKCICKPDWVGFNCDTQGNSDTYNIPYNANKG